ncbi:response regulator transcription factor [Streptomyces sp. NPDC002643]
MRSPLTDTPSPPRGDGHHVLLVVDDPAIAELLTTTMESAGCRTSVAVSGAEGMAWLAHHRYDLVVWDNTLPDQERFLQGRRGAPADRPPVLFLAADDTLHRLVPELRLGQTDYILKPIRIAELLDRALRLLSERGGPERRHAMPCCGDLVLDDIACRARRGTRPLHLTPAEYRLLRHLVANAGRVLSKEQIGRHVWGAARPPGAIEKLVARLRRKVDQEDPALIHTRRGFGYRFGCPHVRPEQGERGDSRP